jgi:excisionase family DNA binding protein
VSRPFLSNRASASVTARVRLLAALSPEVVAAIEELVAESVAAALTDAQPNGGSLLSVDAAADYLGISPRTLERRIANGEVRSVTFGRRRLLRRDELDRFAAAREDATPATSPRRRK